VDLFHGEQMESSMIIGLSGKKGSGKSTVAEYLHRKLDGSMRLPFAFKLKLLAQECFGASMEQVYGDKKDTMTECGMTGRETMQRVGAAMRSIWPDCWINAWQHEVVGIWAESGSVPVIVEDVRYENEVRLIKKMGGIVIRLTRSPAADLHESEVALDRYAAFDAVIQNEGMTVGDTCAEVASICREKGIV
jgi:hypothetical protein